MTHRARFAILAAAIALAAGIAAAVSPRGAAAGGDGLPGGTVRQGGGPSDPIVYEVEGVDTGNRGFPGDFGRVLTRLDDVDGDGVPEFAASASSFQLPDGRLGFVGLFSGRTGARLRYWRESEGVNLYGVVLGAGGDADRDGIRELIIMHPSGAFDVVSPASGALLYQVPRPAGDGLARGDLFAPLGDVDGDGASDFAFGFGPYNDARRTPEQPFFAVGRVAVHSGADGRLLWERLGEEYSFFGRSPVCVGDISGDGVPDLLVGQPQASSRQRGGLQSPSPMLFLLSGSDGTTLDAHIGEPWQLALGHDQAFLGDTDGNGQVEVVVAAPYAHHGQKIEAGWVGVYELPGFHLRYQIWGEHGQDFCIAADRLGFWTSEAEDADGDGALDFLLGTYHARTLSPYRVYGRFYLHSGRTGALLQVYEGLHSPIDATPRPPYAGALAPLGDVDGDGRAEFLVGAAGWEPDQEERGYVQVLRYQSELVPFRRGDVDGDGRDTITDIVRLVTGILAPVPIAPCLAVYDVNGDNVLNANDVLDFVCYVFYCRDHEALEPATPGLRCGRHARLKPGPREVPFGCEEHRCGG